MQVELTAGANVWPLTRVEQDGGSLLCGGFAGGRKNARFTTVNHEKQEVYSHKFIHVFFLDSAMLSLNSPSPGADVRFRTPKNKS